MLVKLSGDARDLDSKTAAVVFFVLWCSSARSTNHPGRNHTDKRNNPLSCNDASSWGESNGHNNV